MLKTLSILCFVAFTLANLQAEARIFVSKERNGVLKFSNRGQKKGTTTILFEPHKFFVSRVKYSSKTHLIPLHTAKYSDLIEKAALRHALDHALIKAVIHAESGFNQYAVSRKGARGLMQLMPQTARRFGVRNSFSPEMNIIAGSHYLRILLDRFNGRTDLALAAYNAGEGAVERHRGIPPYPETREYVRRVLQLKKRYTS